MLPPGFLRRHIIVLPLTREWIEIAEAEITTAETAVLPLTREWIEMFVAKLGGRCAQRFSLV